MEIEQFNGQVKNWNFKNYQGIKDRYLSLINSPNRSGEGFETLKYRLGYDYGEIDRIAYKFNRYLVFVHKGVGKGRAAGSNKVNPKEWLNPVLDENVPELADIVIGLKAEAALKRIQIK